MCCATINCPNNPKILAGTLSTMRSVKEAVADEVVTEKVEEEKPQELETLLKVGSISSGPRNFNILDCLGVRHQAF